MAAHESKTLLTSAARTATTTTAVQTNMSHRGAYVTIDVAAITDTPSLTPTIRGYDPASGAAYDILVGSAITNTTTDPVVLKVYPGITASANVSASDVLPARWDVEVAHADADSATYSVGVHLLP